MVVMMENYLWMAYTQHHKQYTKMVEIIFLLWAEM